MTSIAPSPSTTAMQRRYVFRGSLAAIVLMVGILPPALGMQPCTFASLFHHPCPGCGLSRAAHLLLGGHVVDSLRIHPFLVPLLAANAYLAVAIVRATFLVGVPWTLYRERFGRISLCLLGGVYAAMVGLWMLRAMGLFGGSMPI